MSYSLPANTDDGGTSRKDSALSRLILLGGLALANLDALGFDPLDPPPTRIANQEKEDAFCENLRKVGGKWWQSERRFLDVLVKDWDDTEPTDEELRNVWFGWPKEGGLLVLQFEQDEKPDDIGRLRMAVTMEERCKIMKERFVAEFYEDPALYEGLADVRLQ
ncbi:hypothetical protein B7463_g6840, partial [Scytalidium lignicola]